MIWGIWFVGQRLVVEVEVEGVSFEFGPPPTFVRPSTLLLPFSLSFPSLTCATIQHAIDSIPATKPSMSLESNTQSPNRRSMSALAPGSQAEEEEDGDIVSKSKSSASELPPSLFLSREASPKEKRRKPGGSGEESASRERRCLSLWPNEARAGGSGKNASCSFFSS